MSSIDRNNPFAPPEAVVADVATAADMVAGGELAGRGRRLAAVCIDMLPLYAVLGAIAWLTSFDLIAYGKNPTFAAMTQLVVVSFGTYFALNGWWLHRYGQSIGKRVLGIRIVRTDGSKADLFRLMGLRMLVLGLLGLVPFVGKLVSLADALFIFGNARRCLHDHLADTVVVKA